MQFFNTCTKKTVYFQISKASWVCKFLSLSEANLASIIPPGLPLHQLELKSGAIVMLILNLSIKTVYVMVQACMLVQRIEKPMLFCFILNTSY